MVTSPTLYCLPQVESTNTWCKQNIQRLNHGDAVYTTCQTAGKGRLGSRWQNAPNQALYYSVVFKQPMQDPASLPLAVSLVVVQVLQQQFGITCQVKWPNDLILGGKKLAGILCEATPEAVICGIGINLAQTPQQFLQAHLPHATSVAAHLGGSLSMEHLPQTLAQELTHAFGQQLHQFYQQGFSACRTDYKKSCVNLNRQVFFEGGSGIAVDVDEQGRLVVETRQGEKAVFTGEVRVKGIYETL